MTSSLLQGEGVSGEGEREQVEPGGHGMEGWEGCMVRDTQSPKSMAPGARDVLRGTHGLCLTLSY